jgi:hypothetical protein
MPAHRSEDDIRADYRRAMGGELGDVMFLLWHDLTWLYFEWHQYKELFGSYQSRIDIMNESAPRFFWSLDRVLWQDILLSISRLADPPATSGQQNLSFRRLVRLIPSDGPQAEFLKALDTFETDAQFARGWRHTRFAHRDLDHASDSEANPLPFASRASVTKALASASQVLNTLELHYCDSTTGYEYVSDPIGGAPDLLHIIDRGLAARREDEDGNRYWEPRPQ